MKTIKGNLIDLAFEGHFDIIIQGCNCQCRMKSGIAKEIARRIPKAEEIDNETVRGDRSKLGGYSSSITEWEDGFGDSFVTINGYTQFYWGTDSRKVDYEAVRSVFRNVRNDYLSGYGASLKVAYPKIGCGLAGGDWEIISKIIDEELEGFDHTYVEFDGT